MSNLNFIFLVLACYGFLFAATLRGRENFFVVLTFLCMVSFLFATKIVRVFGYPLVPSAPIVAIIFYSGTIAQEFYGAAAARKLLAINLGTMAGLTFLGGMVQRMDRFPRLNFEQEMLGASYDRIFAFFPQALLAALIAFTTAYTINFVVTKLFHRMYGDRFFAARSFASVAVSNLVDITMFVALAYAWNPATWGVIFTTWFIRLICILVGIPVIWMIKQRFAQKDVAEVVA